MFNRNYIMIGLLFFAGMACNWIIPSSPPEEAAAPTEAAANTAQGGAGAEFEPPAAEPDMGVSGASAEDVAEINSAPVNEVAVVITRTAESSVTVIARGSFADGCSEIGQITQNPPNQGREFVINLLARTYTQGACIQVITPFEERVPLDVAGLAAGQYQVRVNEVTTTFTLPANLTAQGPTLPAMLVALNFPEPQKGYHFSIPEGFTMRTPIRAVTNIYGPSVTSGPESLRASLTIISEPAGQRNLEDAVQEPLRGLPGSFTVGRGELMLGGEKAVVIEGLPGRFGTRILFTIHNGMLYRFTFAPIDQAFPQLRQEAELLWRSVTETFAFTQ